MRQAAEWIRQSEYQFSPLDDAQTIWSAPNRAHGLRARIDEDGLLVTPRVAEGRPWRGGLQLTGFGRDGAVHHVAKTKPQASGNRAEFRRPEIGITEWYVNDEKGLEQGFTIARAPEGPSGPHPLVLAMTLGHGLEAQASEGGRSIRFALENGTSVMEYGGLRVTDAAGNDLAARLSLADDRLTITVVDAGARYPITVDPLLTSPAWTGEGQRADDQFGFTVATAGDINGDGFSDVLVGAPQFDGAHGTDGRAYLYLGSATGPSAAADWVADGNQGNARLGESVACAGDVNGDGFDDVIIGAPFYNGEGRAFVWLGSASGLGADGTPANADWFAGSNQAGATFGNSVGTAGDVNNDGYDDVIIGAPWYESGGHRRGWAFVWLGSASDLGADGSPANADWHAEGNGISDQFGESVATAGDVNGDGYDDVIIGWPYYLNLAVPFTGRVCVWHGGPADLGADGTPANADWMIDGPDAQRNFGMCVATAGDVNGDGYSDVIIGSPDYLDVPGNAGRAYVHLGSALGLQAAPDWTGFSGQSADQYGGSVAAAGDVNGDGFGDIIVGCTLYDDPEVSEGFAFVYYGSATGVPFLPGWYVGSDQALAWFGSSVAAAGDVNGDGFADVIVGASLYDHDNLHDAGAAFIFEGAPAGLSTGSAWSPDGDQASAEFGYCVASALDVNGDGYGDVIVGAPLFDTGAVNGGKVFVYHGSASGLPVGATWTEQSDQLNANFGHSVAGAGDVDGDGYDDVIIGAYHYDNGQADEGGAFVYLGSAQGLSHTVAWSGEGEQASAQYGCSVASAGDVNGDGFADVIVGAEFYDNGQNNEGRAYIYFGSVAGLSQSADWTGENDHTSAFFGGSVACAGDVNGDGFSDVIVGEQGYDGGEMNEGRAYLYRGSANGPSLAANWTEEPDADLADFGGSVASAGDVNGDGYSDVIVGAPGFDGNNANEGKVFVYHGGPGGLSHAWSLSANVPQADAHTGECVASAGDVNGDGFSDVIMGAWGYDGANTDEGKVNVYLGSANGLTVLNAWTAEGNQDGAEYGRWVASAGDVNGDGFADVVVGARHYNNPEADEGRVFLYYGNGRDGLDRAPQQMLTAGNKPIGLLGISNSESGVRLKMRARSVAGRGKVGLEWEIKPLGTPFDGSDLGRSSLLDSGAPGGNGSVVSRSWFVGGLTAGTAYHWRLRVITDSPFFPRGPWMSLAYNAQSETDFRTPPNLVDVADPVTRVSDIQLQPARPNPFGAATTLGFTLPQAGRVRLEVYDVRGRRVSTLLDGMQDAGAHSVTWDGRGGDGEVATGAYFARLTFAGETRTTRLVRMK